MFNSHLFENSRPDGFSVLEIVSDEPGEMAAGFVPLKMTRLNGDVAGPLADLRLTQTFGYAREQSDKTLEAVYRFPLPGDAAVTGVTARFGEVEIVAELKAREQAETDYQEAVAQGRQAALATRESPDVFTLRVAGLQPEQEVTIETRFVQLARPDGLNWTLRVPLTTSPRYVRADEIASRHAQGQPLALLRDPGHRFTLDMTFAACGDVRSATHSLDVQETDDSSKRVRLEEGEVLPDRDLVLSWRAVQEESRPGLSILLHDDAASGYTYFLALVAPPKANPVNQSVPREVVLLVDHSGSMRGAKWEASDWAAKQLLNGLIERDSFALGLFHDTTKWYKVGGLSTRLVHPAAADNVQRAARFLDDSKDSGGTELGVALEQALNLKRTPGDMARPVLIVTDAEVSDGGRLMRLVDGEADKPDRRRVSVLCIDAAPNAFLANELAERGGGIARFLTSQPEEEDITTALDAVLEDFAQPIFANMRLNVNRPNAQASGRSSGPGRDANSSYIDLGDLPRGRAVWVSGRVPRGEEGRLNFTVGVGGRDVTSAQIDMVQSDSHPAIKALFGARRVLALEYLMASYYDPEALAEQLARFGYDPKTALQPQPRTTVYAENAIAQPRDALKKLLVSEALEYGLASSATAFVARRTEAGNPVEEIVAVANALPAGWSEGFAGGGFQGSPMMRSGGITAPAGYAVYAAAPPMPAPMAPMSDAVFDLGGPPSTPQSSDDLKAEFKNALKEVGSMPSKLMQAWKTSAKPAPDQQSLASGQSLFAGIPTFQNSEAILFDTNRVADAPKMKGGVRLTKLEVRFPGGSPDLNVLGGELTVLLFVEDMAIPRAKVKLADLLRQGGARPLNVQVGAGQAVKITLVSDAANAIALPAMEVALHW